MHSKSKCKFCPTSRPSNIPGQACPNYVVMADDVVRNCRIFDALDFDAFSYHKDFELLRRIHSPDVVVTQPEGVQTVGIDDHVAYLDGFFVVSEVTHILAHITEFGFKNLSVGLSIFEGIVSPSALAFFPNAVVGNKFRIRFLTFNEWLDNGSFNVEKLYWDNFALVRQITEPTQAITTETAIFDISNPHQANYFLTPFDQCIVDKNINLLREFYHAVNRKDFRHVENMLHETVSFVKPTGIYGFTRQELIEFLMTLDLSLLTTVPVKLQKYIWVIPEKHLEADSESDTTSDTESTDSTDSDSGDCLCRQKKCCKLCKEPCHASTAIFGAKDWVCATSIIQVCANNKCTVDPCVKPAIAPSVKPSPIPFASLTRWHDGKISEIHLLWDNLTILTQLGLPPNLP